MNPFYPSFSTLKKQAKTVEKDWPIVKIAFLADSAVQFLNLAVKGAFASKGFQAEIFEADIDQIQLQLFSPESDLFSFFPDFILIFEALPHTKKRFYKSSNRSTFHNIELDRIKEYAIASEKFKASLIYFNHLEVGDNVYGHFSSKIADSIEYQLKKTNLELIEFSQETSNIKVFDFNSLAASIGYEASVDRNIAVQTDMQISLDLLPQVAYHLVGQMLAEKGTIKKCLILDLDNTLWGGIIGDDGLEQIKIGGLGIGKAFTEMQRWALELKNRGIILAVVSKNTEHIAKKPFEEHPEMLLRLDDISVFMANWDNKVINIQKIQEVLNIGFDSMVFLDDNPFERGIVKENLPLITVPELPEDPVNYIPFLRGLSLFETSGVSQADTQRTKQYQTEAKRQAEKVLFSNEGAYLQSLSMKATVEELNSFNLPRVAQLIQRSNQFNLRTERLTESELLNWNSGVNNNILAVSLSDKHGSHGLIAIIMLEDTPQAVFIRNWIMSCRVLKRDVEKFSLNLIVERYKNLNKRELVGEYIPTLKNELVANHYKNLGFQKDEGFWKLKLNNYEDLNNHIALIK